MMTEPQYQWSEDRVEMLKQLWGEGLSGSQISERLPGRPSRSSCISKARRLGLAERRESVWQRTVFAAPHVDRNTRVANGLNRKGAESSGKPPRVTVDAKAFKPLAGFTPVPFMETGRHSCRWPVGGEGANLLCCGAWTEATYCPDHQRASEGSALNPGPRSGSELAHALRRFL